MKTAGLEVGFANQNITMSRHDLRRLFRHCVFALMFLNIGFAICKCSLTATAAQDGVLMSSPQPKSPDGLLLRLEVPGSRRWIQPIFMRSSPPPLASSKKWQVWLQNDCLAVLLAETGKVEWIRDPNRSNRLWTVDDDTILAGSDWSGKRAELIELPSGRRRQIPVDGLPLDVAPAKKLLAVYSDESTGSPPQKEGKVSIFDFGTFTLQHSWPVGVAENSLCVQGRFSNSGRYFVELSHPDAVVVHDLETSSTTRVQVRPECLDVDTSLHWLTDDTRFLLCCTAAKSLRIFHRDSGKLAQSISFAKLGLGWLSECQVTPDGNLILNDHEAVLHYDLQAGKVLWRNPLNPHWCAAICAAEKTVWVMQINPAETINPSSYVFRIRLADGELLEQAAEPVRFAGFREQGRFLVWNDGRFAEYELKQVQGSAIPQYQMKPFDLPAVAVSTTPAARLKILHGVAGYTGDVLQLFSAHDFSTLTPPADLGDRTVSEFTVDERGENVCVALSAPTEDGLSQDELFFLSKQGRLRWEVRRTYAKVGDMAISSDGTLLATTERPFMSDGNRDPQLQQVLAQAVGENPRRFDGLLELGYTLCVVRGTADGKIRGAKFVDYLDAATRVCFTPTENWIAISTRKKIVVCDAELQELRTIDWSPEEKDCFNPYVFSEGKPTAFWSLDHSTFLISGGVLGDLQVWDIRDGTMVWEMRAHRAPIIDLKVSQAEGVLASESIDGTVTVWHLPTILQKAGAAKRDAKQ